jgi:tetratricopeptide (TPR) repeat protein
MVDAQTPPRTETYIDLSGRYWGVFLIDCSSEANAENSFAALGHRAGKGGEYGAGQEWLSQTSKPWILALDNANDPEMDLSKFIPVAGNGHVLVTTRNPNAQIYSTVGSFQFRGMDPEEAITLLLRLAYPEREPQSVSQCYRQYAKAIASELGFLALALKQAAITIRREFLPLERYLKSLVGCRKALLSRPTVNCAADASIIATWELPFTGIAKGKSLEYRDAVDLIHVFAFMHFASIPASLFARSSDGMKQSKSLGVQPPAIFEPHSMQDVGDRVLTAARILYDHSIISIAGPQPKLEDELNKRTSKKFFSLHPAIHQWARERLDEAQQRNWLDCTTSILAHSISSNLETSGRAFCRLLLPHIESCIFLLERTYRNLPGSLEQAFSLERFGLVYAENGLWKRARSLQLKVVKFKAQHLGKRHADTIHAQRALANTYWNLFEIRQCLEIQRQILATHWWSRPSVFHWMTWPPWKPVHVPYCLALDDITRSLWLAGRRDLSRRTGERALDGLASYLGPDDPLTLNAMFNLARTYLHIGEHKKSHDLLIRVLEMRMHFFGPDHPDTLMARNEVGMNLCAQKLRLDEAERLVHDVLQSRKRILGEEHAYTLWSANDLSKIYCELHRFDEAARILEEIVPVVKRTLGDSHVGMIMTKSNLSRAYILRGKWDAAGELIRQLREIVPPDHPDWVHVNWGYALVLVHDGGLEEAEDCCNTLLSKIAETKVVEPDNARVVAIAELLLRIFRLQGREYDISELKERFPQLDEKEVRHSIDPMPLAPLSRRATLSSMSSVK